MCSMYLLGCDNWFSSTVQSREEEVEKLRKEEEVSACCGAMGSKLELDCIWVRDRQGSVRVKHPQ